MLPTLPLGPVYASLAQRQPLWALRQPLDRLRKPLDPLCQPLDTLRLTRWPSLALRSSWLPLRGLSCLCVPLPADPLGTNSASLLCIHCPSLLITDSISLIKPRSGVLSN